MICKIMCDTTLLQKLIDIFILKTHQLALALTVFNSCDSKDVINSTV